MKISKPTNHKWSIPGGGGVNDQMQIVNTKLPNENIQAYRPQMIDSGRWGVNDQMQIVIKLPNGTTKVAQNDSEWPISPDSQLYQSLPTGMAQNDLEWPILPDSQLFQSFLTKWLIWGGG